MNYANPLNISKVVFLLLSIFALVPTGLYAQSGPLRLVPLSTSPSLGERSFQTRQQAPSANSTVLTLPFWDDFSQPLVDTLGFATPDTARWISNTGALVTTGVGIAPPTLGVVSFDGAGLQGQPQGADSVSIGISDQLTSCPINLTLVPEAERSSVYFSFFWQPRGEGEFPELASDSLRLQFSTTDTANQWVTVWRRAGGDSTLENFTEVFTQEILPVNDPAFFHERFQFRFQSYNRQSGAFDTWNIDYVYLNSGRSATDIAYPDAAITAPPTSLFGEYTQVPMQQLRADPSRYFTEPSAPFYNLRGQPVGTTFEAFVNDALTGGRLERLSTTRNTLSPLPTAFDRRTMTVDALSAGALDLNQDSLLLETEFYIETGDRPLIESIAGGDTLFSPTVDYRVNDTVRTTFVVNESFAYDDGTAEFGVELNQTGGRVAYQFVTPEADLLTHVDIHFPQLEQNQGALLQIFVWKTLSDTAGNEVVLRQNGTEPANRNGVRTANGFSEYTLESPIVVQDTFYIGYQLESTDQFIVIGFDKNTDTGDRIFFNTSVDWEQNTDLQGSLMMRPRFDRERAQLVTDIPSEEEATDVVVFPNPSTGLVQIQGSYDELQVLDLLGREIIRASYTPTPVNLVGHQPGLYIFRFRVKDNTLTRKVMLR